MSPLMRTAMPLSPSDDGDRSASMRTMLVAILAFGVVGLEMELVLIGHLEGALQWTPLVLLAGGFAVVVWYGALPRRASVLAMRVAMALFVVGGAAGVLLHYLGNREFELEMYPSMHGVELVRETLSGATPVLAPGSLALLGLTGLVVTYREPHLSGHDAGAGRKEVRS